jgi:hypothetical protein
MGAFVILCVTIVFLVCSIVRICLERSRARAYRKDLLSLKDITWDTVITGSAPSISQLAPTQSTTPAKRGGMLLK